jgi:hypothetical protein
MTKYVIKTNLLKFFLSVIVALLGTIVAVNAISPMLFGSLGKTPDSSGWNYVIILNITLSAIAPLIVISRAKLKFKLINYLAEKIAFILCVALLGFYYGGIVTNNNPQVASLSAIASSIITGIIYQKNQFIVIAILSIATVATYSFALLAGTMAISLLSASRFILGILWSAISLIYIGLTIFNGNLNIQTIVKLNSSKK